MLYGEGVELRVGVLGTSTPHGEKGDRGREIGNSNSDERDRSPKSQKFNAAVLLVIS
jgi:hypothetical protein